MESTDSTRRGDGGEYWVSTAAQWRSTSGLPKIDKRF
jgi:hypothetical protein